MSELLSFGSAPGSVKRNIRELQEKRSYRKQTKKRVMEKHDTERYLVIVFRSRAAKNQVLGDLGLPEDERYLAASLLNLSRKPKDQLVLAEDKAAPINKGGATG